MCDPITIAAAAVMAAGQGFSALQATSQANYAAKVADQNARLAGEAARQETDNTRDAMLAHYRKVSALQGQQRVAMAAGGIDVDFGNAADLAADTKMLAQEDARRIYDQGAQNVRGFNIEGMNYQAQAAASRQAGKGALIGGMFDMAGTALGGASQYNQFKAKVGARNAYGVSGVGNIY